VRERCLIVSSDTCGLARVAVRSVLKHAKALEPIVLFTGANPDAFDAFRKSGEAEVLDVPSELLRGCGRDHGTALDWYLEAGLPTDAERVWFLDSDAQLVSDGAVEYWRSGDPDLMGTEFNRDGTYTYARPVFMMVHRRLLNRMHGPCCFSLPSGEHYPRHEDDLPVAWDTCELLTIACRRVGGFLRMAASIGKEWRGLTCQVFGGPDPMVVHLGRGSRSEDHEEREAEWIEASDGADTA